MAFGKKTAPETFDVSKTGLLAQEAMRNRRCQLARLPIRITLKATLMNHFSNKAIIQMLAKMGGYSVPKVGKDLDQSYEDSKYFNVNDVVVIPCRVLKAAIVEGAISTNKMVTKAELKRDLRVEGFTSPLHLPKGAKIERDVRLVRNQTGVPDVRARALIPEGTTADFVLKFPTTLSPDKIVAALDGAGQSIGIFDNRPQNGGDCGMFDFDILPDKEVARVINECMVAEKPYDLPEWIYTAFEKGSHHASDDASKKVTALIEHVNGQNGMKKRRARSGAEDAG